MMMILTNLKSRHTRSNSKSLVTGTISLRERAKKAGLTRNQKGKNQKHNIMESKTSENSR